MQPQRLYIIVWHSDSRPSTTTICLLTPLSGAIPRPSLPCGHKSQIINHADAIPICSDGGSINLVHHGAAVLQSHEFFNSILCGLPIQQASLWQSDLESRSKQHPECHHSIQLRKSLFNWDQSLLDTDVTKFRAGHTVVISWLDQPYPVLLDVLAPNTGLPRTTYDFDILMAYKGRPGTSDCDTCPQRWMECLLGCIC